jgi:hypothetical protein
MQRGRGRIGLHASADRSRPCTSHYSERTVFFAPSRSADTRSRRPIEAELSHDWSAIWLRNAAIGLCILAAAAAAVSFTAQYRMVYADRQLALVAGLEAAIPDTAALVFACLGVASALHGRRALRARALTSPPSAPAYS